MSDSKILFSSTPNPPDVQHTARALYDAGLLGAYYTNFGLPEDGRVLPIARALDRLFGTHLALELRRRAITEVPKHLIHLYPHWEVLRTALSRANFNEQLVDTVEAHSLRRLDHHVARHVRGFSAVYAYNRTALASFRAAKKAGALCILGVRDLEPSYFASLRSREYEKYPLLATEEQKRLDAIERSLTSTSKAEWNLADLVVMNSDVCRQSYASYGDAEKIRVVPLAFPKPSAVERARERPYNPKLRVLWAGIFSHMKGAHYLIQALKLLPQRVALELNVFGKQELPPGLLAEADRPIQVRPTVPRAQLFDEYTRADVLVLPTLADTFGMVITEAMSQGLPVITTARAGASRFIRSGENGIVVPVCDAEALAEALTWCAESRPRLDEMREEARKTAASWQWPDFRHTLGAAVSDVLRQRQ